jgi:NADP-dependent 3-hydroxy acid dehydrogenase YdfG
MKIVLKPIKEQVIILTGATSGTGWATAKMAAKEGARVVAVARNEESLEQLTEEINSLGGEAIYVKADVGKENDVARIADTAIRAYGTFDTWINNADVSVAAGCLEVSIEDMKRMIDTNFWGVVFGSRVAANHFRIKGEAGAIINVSTFSEERSTNKHAPYSISKRAVHEWTDALRNELEKDKIPVSISLIHLGKVDSVHYEHVTSSVEKKTGQSKRMQVPEGISKAILHCAERPKRDLYVSAQSKFFTVLDSLKPKFTEKADVPNTSVYHVAHDSFSSENAEQHDNEHGTNEHRGDSARSSKKRSSIFTVLIAGVGAGIWLLSKRKNKSIKQI